MSEQWLHVIFAGGFAGAATFGGMMLVLARENWSRRHSATLVSLSAGVLLGVGFLHILPESMELTPHAPLYVVLAFVLFYFLEHHLLIHAGHEEQHHTGLGVDDCHDDCCDRPHPMGFVAFIGMGLHSAIDGMIIGTGFEVDHSLGLLAALGVIAHEVPEGIAMVAILLHYGWQRKSAIQLTSFVALATPLSAILTFALVRNLSPEWLGALLAMAGGSFVYIAASDLIPESHRSRGFSASLALCVGVLIAWL
ncbi:MAG: ZIP family metal transporter, partial [Desulfuromonadales bacterium]|nr:ZIP family metal transporter [Desulfuromonadales bacterium]